MTTTAAKPIRAATLALLGSRAPGATICPSEVARAVAEDHGGSARWRDVMPLVHAAVDALIAEGTVTISWKGKPLASRDGPYRIGRAG